jgi:NAD(P)-dependent dehydrogenase (short-subunit alcohol dehydrogenase family)
MADVMVVGGTSGIGQEVARSLAGAGDRVIVTGRDAQRAETAAKEIGGETSGLGFDLTRPNDIAGALAGIPRIDHLVLTAIDRDQNTAADYNVDRGLRLATLKLVGYTEVIHTLLPRLTRDGAIVIFGGLAKDRPYPGSTTVSTVNGAVMGLVHTLAVELAPIRVNAIHPGIVGDSPYWRDKPLDQVISRTPTGRLATMRDVADAVVFLLRNSSVNGIHLNVDGGWLLS